MNETDSVCSSCRAYLLFLVRLMGRNVTIQEYFILGSFIWCVTENVWLKGILLALQSACLPHDFNREDTVKVR